MTDAFARLTLAGLSQRRKVVPARFFYDRRGSELFEAITRLPDYYLTRAEIRLLRTHAPAIAEAVGTGRVVVEFGSGSSTKTPLLLAHLRPAAYVPVDISADFLRESSARLAATMPGLDIHPLAGDFTRPLDLPTAVRGQPMLGFFPGSTIGNLTPAAAVDLLRSFAATLGQGAALVIGMDLRKEAGRLIAAYDDPQGVTAAFNLNLLYRINRELGGDIDVGAFRHRALWNDASGRIEMHLEAVRNICFHVCGQAFRMRAGETIHTENSHKYRLDEAALLARAGGWEPRACWVDSEEQFSLHLWFAAEMCIEP